VGLDVDDGDAEDDEEGSPDQGCLAAAVPSLAEHRIAGSATLAFESTPVHFFFFLFISPLISSFFSLRNTVHPDLKLLIPARK